MPIPDADFIDAMRRTIHLVLPEFRNELTPIDPNTQAHVKVFVVLTPAGGIPARSGDTPGKADCNAYEFNRADELVLKPVNHTVYNLSTSPVGSGEFITATQEMPTGRLLADVGGGGGLTMWIAEFETLGPLPVGQVAAAATMTKDYSNGSAPGMSAVFNTCGIFSHPEAGACGVAVWNYVDNRWQIVQLECIQGDDQKVVFDTSLGDSMSYGITPVPVPFSTEAASSQGDLLQLEADGSLTFMRAPNGPLDVTAMAVIGDVIGVGSDGDKSLFQIDYDDLGGGGWTTLPIVLAVQHPYFRVPPQDYGMGGTATSAWTLSLGGVGHKLRVTARTVNGNTVTSLAQSTFQVRERI